MASGTASEPAVDELVDAALDRIAAGLGRRGQWTGEVLSTATGQRTRDLAAPLTALGTLALVGVEHPVATRIVERSREHLVATAQPGGLWRYYRDIPPDTDDTAMCALALGQAHPQLREQTRTSLAGMVRPDGRFPTWFAPGWEAVIDPVANAHCCAVVGPGTTTRAAVAWLCEVVASGSEAEESAYYREPLDLHVAVTRAFAAGVTGLLPALELAGERARERLVDNCGLTAYTAAQAMVVAHAAGRMNHRASHAGRQLLGATASLDAAGVGWPGETLFRARNRPDPGIRCYQSAAVVSALCVRALTLPPV